MIVTAWEQLPPPHLATDPLGNPRSSQWPKVRALWLKDHDECAVCGTTHGCEVHHVKPFHLFPGLELNSANFITLCDPHHLLFGHLMLWASWNEHVREDAAAWREKITHRPKAA